MDEIKELPNFVIPKFDEVPNVCIYMNTFPLFLLIYYVYIWQYMTLIIILLTGFILSSHYIYI